MLLDQPIPTPFGFALAPLNLTAAQQHTQALQKQSSISIPHPRYSAEGYQSSQWKRTSFIIPAASPRSTYSNPLCGGEGQEELPAGTHEKLARDAKYANQMPHFGNHDPLPGMYIVGAEDTDASLLQSSSLVVERLVPVRASTRTDTKILFLGHGLGYCKETLLPLLDRLVQDPNHNIDQVWVMDALGHGLTSQCNTPQSKDDLLTSQHRIVDSNDYARDMILFLTCYLPQILSNKDEKSSSVTLPYTSPRLTKHKIVAIGHSFAGTSMLQASVHLPDLFESIAVIEPIIIHESWMKQAIKIPLSQFTLMKKDHWPSRVEARQEFAKDRMTASWDPRVIDCFVAGGLYEDKEQDGVKRSCDRVAEALCIRGNRPGFQLGMGLLKHIKVKVLYISAHKPMMSTLDNVKHLAEQIPKLDFQVVKGSHNLPQEQPELIADMIAKSLLQEGSTSKL
jgi:pimeloyl-ACP methyl ester carboxylesterase